MTTTSFSRTIRCFSVTVALATGAVALFACGAAPDGQEEADGSTHQRQDPMLVVPLPSTIGTVTTPRITTTATATSTGSKPPKPPTDYDLCDLKYTVGKASMGFIAPKQGDAFSTFEGLLDQHGCYAGGLPPSVEYPEGQRTIVRYDSPQGDKWGNVWYFAVCPYTQAVENDVKTYAAPQYDPVHSTRQKYCFADGTSGPYPTKWVAGGPLGETQVTAVREVVVYDPRCNTCLEPWVGGTIAKPLNCYDPATCY